MGRTIGLPFSEYDDRDEAIRRAETWCEIEWLRYHMGRQPGWAAFTFKDLFGAWPAAGLKSLTPQPASDALWKWVRSRDNKFKRDKNKNEAHGRAALLRSAAPVKRARKPFGRNGSLERRSGEPDMEGDSDHEGDG